VIISGSDDKTIKLFDVRSGNCEHSIQCLDSVGGLQYHDNTLLTIIKRESAIFWYDFRMGSLKTTLNGHTKAVSTTYTLSWKCSFFDLFFFHFQGILFAI
jgi:WD40 repeat protein